MKLKVIDDPNRCEGQKSGRYMVIELVETLSFASENRISPNKSIYGHLVTY